MYDARNSIDVHFKEILKILSFDSKYNPNQIKFEDFLSKFEILYKKLNINKYVFSKVFKYKILNNLIIDYCKLLFLFHIFYLIS